MNAYREQFQALLTERATVELTTVYDCMGANLGKFPVPAGVLLAGYVTGSGAVPWTAAQFAAHPTAIRIDQSPVNTALDELADVLDVENGAATLADIPGWLHAARGNYHAAARPGQRQPAVYCNQSTLTPVANTLVKAGIAGPVPIWLAAPMSTADAAAKVLAGSGPFPIVGVQCIFAGDHDVSVFSNNWLNTRSAKPPATPPGPGTQTGWRFCSKCQGLFWGAGQSRSHCPAGGIHDGNHSHEYTLGFAR